MNDQRLENIFGALALTLSDGLLAAAQRHVSGSAPAAAIALIGHVPGLVIGQLSRALGLSHPGTVRLVDRLVGEDLVQRRRSDEDGRAVSLHLTRSGETACGAILSARQAALAQRLSSLTVAEKQSLQSITEKLLKDLIVDVGDAFRACRLCDADVCERCPVEAELERREAEAARRQRVRE